MENAPFDSSWSKFHHFSISHSTLFRIVSISSWLKFLGRLRELLYPAAFPSACPPVHSFVPVRIAALGKQRGKQIVWKDGTILMVSRRRNEITGSPGSSGTLREPAPRNRLFRKILFKVHQWRMVDEIKGAQPNAGDAGKEELQVTSIPPVLSRGTLPEPTPWPLLSAAPSKNSLSGG